MTTIKQQQNKVVLWFYRSADTRFAEENNRSFPICLTVLSTLSHKITTKSFCDNFDKCGFISIIILFPLLRSDMSCRRGWNKIKICHFASNQLPTALRSIIWAFNLQLYRKVIQIRSDTKSFIYSKYLHRCYVLIICLLLRMFKISAVNTHSMLFESRTPLVTDASMTLRQAFSSRCHNLLRWRCVRKDYWFKINLPNRCTLLVYHSKTKLSSDE